MTILLLTAAIEPVAIGRCSFHRAGLSRETFRKEYLDTSPASGRVGAERHKCVIDEA